MSKACNKCGYLLISMHRWRHQNLRIVYLLTWIILWSKIGISPISSFTFQGKLIARYPVTTPSRTLALTAKSTDEDGMQYLQDRLQLGIDETIQINRILMICPGKERIKSSLDGVKDHLNLSEDELRRMILTFPSIISCNFDDNIKQIWDIDLSEQDRLQISDVELTEIDAVQNYLKLSDAELRKVVVAHPAIISYKFDNKVKPTLDAVRDYLMLSDDELRKIVLRRPSIIGYNFDNNIKPTLDPLKNHLKLSDEELRKMIMTCSTIIGYNFDDNIKPTLDAVRDYLMLSDEELRKILLRLPTIISCNFDDNIKPTLDAVRNYLKLSDDELRMIVLRLPSIISLNFDDNIKPTLDTLQDRLEISDAELKKMVVSMPSIIAYSNIVPKLDWMQTTFDLNQIQLLAVVNKQMTLLGVNLDKTLVPGVAFWKECFNDRTDAEAMAEIIRKPRELAQSNKRLQKRSALFKERGIPLKRLWGKATYTDGKLDTWMERHYGESLNSTE